MKLSRLFSALFLSLCTILIPAFAKSPFPENSLIVNEDNSHFFYLRTPDEMTREGLEEFVDQYEGTAVTHLFLCPNASRANFSNRARNAIWEPNCEGVEPDGNWPKCCKLLEERGLDPYTVWIERAREKKISPWLSMRMNDLHCVDDVTNYMHDSFWFGHPEFWRVPNDTTKIWENRALNYKFSEVREYEKNFIDVLFERYDFDGLELDWMRFGYHLTPGHETEEKEFLTEITLYAHQRAVEWSAKREHPIYISVRVPAVPEDAIGLGMDAVAWAKAGLIDLLVPTPFWASADFDIPVERWNQLLEGTNVEVIPGMEILVRAFPNINAKEGTDAQFRGFAVTEKFRGAKSIYLFNWMDAHGNPEKDAAYIKLLKEGLGWDYLMQSEYDIPITYHDTVAPGNSDGAQLPKFIEENKSVSFTIPTGPVPSRGSVCGVLASFQESEGLADAQIAGTLNGIPATVKEISGEGIPYAARTLFFEFPPEAFQEGVNEFALTLLKGKTQKVIFVSARVNGKE